MYILMRASIDQSTGEITTSFVDNILYSSVDKNKFKEHIKILMEIDSVDNLWTEMTEQEQIVNNIDNVCCLSDIVVVYNDEHVYHEVFYIEQLLTPEEKAEQRLKQSLELLDKAIDDMDLSSIELVSDSNGVTVDELISTFIDKRAIKCCDSIVEDVITNFVEDVLDTLPNIQQAEGLVDYIQNKLNKSLQSFKETLPEYF